MQVFILIMSYLFSYFYEMYLGLLNLHAFALLFSPTSVSQAMLSTVGILLLKGIPLRFNPSCNRSEVINESSKLNAFAFHSLML